MKTVGKIIVGALAGIGALAIAGTVAYLCKDKKYLEGEDTDKIEKEFLENPPDEN